MTCAKWYARQLCYPAVLRLAHVRCESTGLAVLVEKRQLAGGKHKTKQLDNKLIVHCIIRVIVLALNSHTFASIASEAPDQTQAIRVVVNRWVNGWLPNPGLFCPP